MPRGGVIVMKIVMLYSASLAGFIIKYGLKNSVLYNLGVKVAKEAIDFLVANRYLIDDMHLISCYIRLMQYIEESSYSDIIDIRLLKGMLMEKVSSLITKDYDSWKTSYICKPSQFFNNMDNIFYLDNKESADYECKYIITSQLDDGSYHIPWGWSDYQYEWSISKNWWKSHLIINNMLYLKGVLSERN